MSNYEQTQLFYSDFERFAAQLDVLGIRSRRRIPKIARAEGLDHALIVRFPDEVRVFNYGLSGDCEGFSLNEEGGVRSVARSLSDTADSMLSPVQQLDLPATEVVRRIGMAVSGMLAGVPENVLAA